MSPNSSKLLKWFLAGVALLLVAGPILSAFTILAMGAGVVVLSAYAIATLALLVALVREALAVRTRKSWWQVILVPALLGMLVFGSYTIMWVGNRTFGYARFALHFPVYSTVVYGLANSLPADFRGESRFVRYEVDPGPPVRVVFPHFGGITDNWTGTVYDPSDEVAKAEGWKYTNGSQEFTAPPGIRELFGGDIVSCSRLFRHYFLCVFT